MHTMTENVESGIPKSWKRLGLLQIEKNTESRQTIRSCRGERKTPHSIQVSV